MYCIPIGEERLDNLRLYAVENYSAEDYKRIESFIYWELAKKGTSDGNTDKELIKKVIDCLISQDISFEFSCCEGFNFVTII